MLSRIATIIFGSKISPLFACLLCVTSVFVWVQPTSGQQRELLEELLAKQRYSPLDRAARKSLNRSFSANYRELEFSKIKKIIDEKFGVKIIMNDDSAWCEIFDDTPVTFQIKDVPLRLGLRLMLAQYEHTFFVRDGTIHVVSLDFANEPEFHATRVINVEHLLQLLGESNLPKKRTALNDLDTQLIEIVVNAVRLRPENAMTEEPYKISIAPGNLVVSGSEDFLERVQQFVSKLEFKMDKQLDSAGYNARDRSARKALERSFSANYEGLDFSEVEKRIEKKYKVNLVLDEFATDSMISGDTIVSFRIKDVPLRIGLRQMLARHGQTFFVDDGVIRVVSLEHAQELGFHATRIFEVEILNDQYGTELIEIIRKAVRLKENGDGMWEEPLSISMSIASGFLAVSGSEDFLERVEKQIAKMKKQLAENAPPLE